MSHSTNNFENYSRSSANITTNKQNVNTQTKVKHAEIGEHANKRVHTFALKKK